MEEKPIIVLQTDFTYAEGAVASVYGVIKSVDRHLEIIDATHEIPQYDTWSASYRLNQYMRFWPKGTVFVSVVDPGVGTARKACVAKTKDGYYIVTPDNGSLTHIKKYVGIDEVREIDETINRLKGKDNERVSIFHGRDLFGYCAARFASGIITYEQVGPAYNVEDIVEHPILQPTIQGDVVKGIFEINDPNFGNLWTNIHVDYFDKMGYKHGDIFHCVIEHGKDIVFDEVIPYYSSFGDAPKGSVMIYHNEMNHIAMAKVVGNLCKDYNLGYGSEYTVSFKKVSE